MSVKIIIIKNSKERKEKIEEKNEKKNKFKK